MRLSISTGRRARHDWEQYMSVEVSILGLQVVVLQEKKKEKQNVSAWLPVPRLSVTDMHPHASCCVTCLDMPKTEQIPYLE